MVGFFRPPGRSRDLATTRLPGRCTAPARIGAALALLAILATLPGCGLARLYEWDARNVVARVGSLEQTAGTTTLRLDERGDGVLELPLTRETFAQASTLSLSTEGDSLTGRAQVVWWIEVGVNLARVPISDRKPGEHLADLASAPAWPARVDAIALQISGKPGATISFTSIALETADWLAPFRIALQERWAARGWTHASINTVAGDHLRPLGLPLVAWASLLAVTLALLAWLAPGSRGVRVRRLVAVALLVWIPLDALWLRQLGARATDTHKQFQGKATERARISASSDRPFFVLAEQVRASVPETARVFVATDLDFEGGRIAYYLYPLNVYWMRDGPELPAAGDLPPGAFILQVAPSRVRVSPDGSRLRLEDGSVVTVERRWSRERAALYRVRS